MKYFVLIITLTIVFINDIFPNYTIVYNENISNLKTTKINNIEFVNTKQLAKILRLDAINTQEGNFFILISKKNDTAILQLNLPSISINNDNFIPYHTFFESFVLNYNIKYEIKGNKIYLSDTNQIVQNKQTNIPTNKIAINEQLVQVQKTMTQTDTTFITDTIIIKDTVLIKDTIFIDIPVIDIPIKNEIKIIKNNPPHVENKFSTITDQQFDLAKLSKNISAENANKIYIIKPKLSDLSYANEMIKKITKQQIIQQLQENTTIIKNENRELPPFRNYSIPDILKKKKLEELR